MRWLQGAKSVAKLPTIGSNKGGKDDDRSSQQYGRTGASLFRNEVRILIPQESQKHLVHATTLLIQTVRKKDPAKAILLMMMIEFIQMRMGTKTQVLQVRVPI